MRNKRLIAGLLLVAVIGVFAIAWPLTGYPSLWHWVRDMPQEPQPTPPFDRAPLIAELADVGLSLGDDVHVRIYKAEMVLEVWMRGEPGDPYRLFKTFEICTYSGGPGPKLKEGDHQAPEGFYRVGFSQLNPNSRHHLAFNLGFPNQYDRSLGRTGSALMVHGGCSSVGCYAMTDAGIDQIYTMVEAALGAGQGEVDVHIFPFRMTDETMAEHAASPSYGYWRNLKEGFDLFEAARVPPPVGACRGRYVFGDALDDPACVPITGWRA
jgi:murein L,D-transpeptidase YafK